MIVYEFAQEAWGTAASGDRERKPIVRVFETESSRGYDGEGKLFRSPTLRGLAGELIKEYGRYDPCGSSVPRIVTIPSDMLAGDGSNLRASYGELVEFQKALIAESQPPSRGRSSPDRKP